MRSPYRSGPCNASDLQGFADALKAVRLVI
jgi:hypothetical protein